MKQQPSILAIDPGVSGGFCYYSAAGKDYNLHPMPGTEVAISGIISYFLDYASMHGDVMKCVIEQVTGYVGGEGQPGARMFTFGENYGFLRGVMIAKGCDISTITPRAWQEAIDFKKPRGIKTHHWKASLREYASNIITLRGLDVDGALSTKTADAFLICRAFQRNLLKEGQQ